MIESTKRKRSKVLIATGVVQLLVAGAAFTYFFYLNGNAESAKSVGLVINDALAKGRQARVGFQSLPSSALALPVASEAMMLKAAFQLPQQRPTPSVAVDCAHIRIASPATYYPGQILTYEFQVMTNPQGATFFGYEWRVTQGTIVTGQGSPKITVDTSNASGRLYVNLDVKSRGSCVLQKEASSTREVPPPVPGPTRNKSQRFQGRANFGKQVSSTLAGIRVEGPCPGVDVSTTTNENGVFSFVSEGRGPCVLRFTRTLGNERVTGSGSVELADGKNLLGDFPLKVEVVATPTPTVSPQTPTPTPPGSSPTPTPPVTPEPERSTSPEGQWPVFPTINETDTGEFSVRWPRALSPDAAGVVMVTYTPPSNGGAPRPSGTEKPVEVQVSANVDGLTLLGPSQFEFQVLGGAPIQWSFPVKVTKERGSTATCNINLGFKVLDRTLNPVPLAKAQIGVPTIPPLTWLAGATVFTPTGLTTLGLGLFPRKPRYVNTMIVDLEKKPLPPNTELQKDKKYYVRLNIGALSKQTIIRNPIPFPEWILPGGKTGKTGQWLNVVVAGEDFLLSKHRFHLFLPGKAPSWVCDCSPEHDIHRCTKKARKEYLDISIEATKINPDATLRIGIYYANNLIQSQLITVAIAETERTGKQFSSTIDYTLAKDLENLASFSPRTLNILTNDNNDGTHKIVINGDFDDAVVFNLTERQVSNAIGAVRRALVDVHMLEYGGSFGSEVQRENRFDPNNAKSKSDFVEDLQRLASCGRLLWESLFTNQLEKGRELRNELLKKPGTIQVSRVYGSDFVFPWGAIYDIPLEGDTTLHRPCRLLDEWDKAQTLINAERPECPYEDTHKRNIICPFGFWGFKHIIEQPPSMPKGRDLQRVIKVSNHPITLLAALSLKLDRELAARHLEELQSGLEATVKVASYSSRKDIETALAQPKVELVYFYCHGGRQPLPGSNAPIPFLGIGDEERLTTGDLITWSDDWESGHWVDTSPLVFINGCHTAEITPEALVNFVDAFVGVYAAGVIGTEIVLDQRIANEAGKIFFYYFKNQNCSVGQALQQVRLTLLLKGNLLGLVYTPYCSADLHLA